MKMNMMKNDLKTLEPKWDKKIKAIHTFEYQNGMTVVDAKIQKMKKNEQKN